MAEALQSRSALDYIARSAVSPRTALMALSTEPDYTGKSRKIVLTAGALSGAIELISDYAVSVLRNEVFPPSKVWWGPAIFGLFVANYYIGRAIWGKIFRYYSVGAREEVIIATALVVAVSVPLYLVDGPFSIYHEAYGDRENFSILDLIAIFLWLGPVVAFGAYYYSVSLGIGLARSIILNVVSNVLFIFALIVPFAILAYAIDGGL